LLDIATSSGQNGAVNSSEEGSRCARQEPSTGSNEDLMNGITSDDRTLANVPGRKQPWVVAAITHKTM